MRRILIGGVVALAAVTWGERAVRSPPPRPEAIDKRFDAPDLAEEWYRLRRQPGPGAPAPARAYRIAQQHRRAMRRYSTRLGERTEGGRFERAAALLDGWEALGPGNIGGRTRALVIHPQRTKVLYAAGVSGGVWRSRNRGRRWEPIGDELVNLAVNALALDPNEPDTLYAGTGEGFYRETVRGTGLPLRGGGIFKSTDGGETWEWLRSTRGVRFHWVNDLVVSPTDGRRVYAATRKGVYRSLDGGARWKRVLNPRANGGCLDLELRPGEPSDFLFAACGTLGPATVWRKADAERNGAWEAVLAEEGMGRTSLAVAPSDPSVVYALSASNVPGPGGNFEQGLHAVFRSRSDGEAGSWEARVRNSDPRRANRTLLSNPVYGILSDCEPTSSDLWLGMGWYTNVIRVDPTDAEVVWAGGVDIFRSDDGGANWNPASWWWTGDGQRGWVHADQHGLVFDPRRPRILYSLNDGGIAVTRNARAAVSTSDVAICNPGSAAVRWRSLSNEYGVTQFYNGAPFPGDPGRYLGGTQDNGTVLGSDRRGSNRWQRILGGDGAYVAVDPRDDRVIYASTQNGNLQKSIDGGLSFLPSTNGVTDLLSNNTASYRAFGPNFLFIAPFVLDPNDPDRLWLGGRVLWRSGDGMGSWNQASAPLERGGKTSAIAVAPGDSESVLVGTSEGYLHRTATAWTTGAASAWEAAQPRAGFVTWVAYDPNAPQIAYATYGGFGGDHVWRSPDGGATWESIDGSGRDALPDVPMHSIVVDPDDGQRLYVGSDVGVFVSLDGGASWMVENTGFAAAVTETLALTEDANGDPWLFAFTHGRGAWRVPL